MRDSIVFPFQVIFIEGHMAVGFRHYIIHLDELHDRIEAADQLYTTFLKLPRNSKRFLGEVRRRSRKSFEDLHPTARNRFIYEMAVPPP